MLTQVDVVRRVKSDLQCSVMSIEASDEGC